MKILSSVAAALLLMLVGCSNIRTTHHVYYGEYGPQVDEMVCVLSPTAGHDVRGTIVFTQQKGFVRVVADVTGLTPGKHGFHIHELGDISKSDGMGTAGHFNPDDRPLGAPGAARRNAGNLGNLDADETGHARLEWDDYDIHLNGPKTILGRSVIVHADEEDLSSQPTGTAGTRVAQGVIGLGVLRPKPHEAR